MGVNSNRMAEINKYLSRENLEKYLQIYSANYIATKLFYPKFTTTAGTVIDRAKLLGIATHTFSSARKLETVKTLVINTNLSRYGVKNPSQDENVKNKKIKSALKKYGCINVFQAQEIKNKSKQTMLDKYGVEYVVQLPSFKPNNGSISKKHKEIYNFLLKNNITCENEIKFPKYNKHYNRIYSPRGDICIQSKKIVIEYNGDLWHANPSLYKKNDLIPTWEGNKLAKDIWEKDKIKKKHIESFGYKVIYIWEKDYIENKDNTLKELLNEISKN